MRLTGIERRFQWGQRAELHFCEAHELDYLFKLRLTLNVKRLIKKAFPEAIGSMRATVFTTTRVTSLITLIIDTRLMPSPAFH